MVTKQDTRNIKEIIKKYKNNMPENEDFRELLYYVQSLFFSEEEMKDLEDQTMDELFSAFGCKHRF